MEFMRLNLNNNNNCDDVDVIITDFLYVLNHAIDKFCPLQTKTVRKNSDKNEWCSPQLRNIIKEKNKKCAIYIRRGRPIT